MKKSSTGFSLIELLIVVAIILIIAAIAIPNLLRSRIAANQASAVGSCRTLNTAEITYSSTYNVVFTYNMAYLAPPAAAGTNPTSTAAGLIDSVLASGSRVGTASRIHRARVIPPAVSTPTRSPRFRSPTRRARTTTSPTSPA